jgi:hypothetical protein
MSHSPTVGKSDIPSSQKEGLWSKFVDSFTQQLGLFLIVALIGILTVFSDNLAARIKFALNRTNLREDRYAALSSQLSGYIFDCELVEEDLTKGWTTMNDLTPIINDYNKDLTDLRRNEYADRALIARYWDDERRAEFVALMDEIRTIDSTFHSLNDEFEQVNNPNNPKRKERVDPARAKATAAVLQPLLLKFELQAQKLLDDLE